MLAPTPRSVVCNSYCDTAADTVSFSPHPLQPLSLQRTVCISRQIWQRPPRGQKLLLKTHPRRSISARDRRQRPLPTPLFSPQTSMSQLPLILHPGHLLSKRCVTTTVGPRSKVLSPSRTTFPVETLAGASAMTMARLSQTSLASKTSPPHPVACPWPPPDKKSGAQSTQDWL